MPRHRVRQKKKHTYARNETDERGLPRTRGRFTENGSDRFGLMPPSFVHFDWLCLPWDLGKVTVSLIDRSVWRRAKGGHCQHGRKASGLPPSTGTNFHVMSGGIRGPTEDMPKEGTEDHIIMRLGGQHNHIMTRPMCVLTLHGRNYILFCL